MSENKRFNMNKIEGVDVDIETSLMEYGIAWILSGCETEYKFYYGIGYNDNSEYNSFDSSFIAADIDIYEEYNWVNFEGIYSYNGIDNKTDYGKLPLPQIIYDLIQYYGYENVFGTSYHAGMDYNPNINRFQAKKGE